MTNKTLEPPVTDHTTEGKPDKKSTTPLAPVEPLPRLIARGWEEICPLVGYKNYRSARNHLEKLGLMDQETGKGYENGRPYLSLDAYRMALLKRHEEGE